MQTHPQDTGSGSAGPVNGPSERRSDQDVRAHFEEGCALLAPFFDPSRQWTKTPMNHLAMRVLKERFQHLSSTELMVMLGGIRNLYEHRRTPVPASKA